MSGSINKVMLIGNVGRDPEIRRMNSGESVCNLSLATSETWNDKTTGERKEKTEWHRVVIFGDTLCRVAGEYVRKGAKLYVEGQIQSRKWVDQAGVEKVSTEIVITPFRGAFVMLDKREDRETIAADPPGPTPRTPQRPSTGALPGGAYSRPAPIKPRQPTPEYLDDEIPF